MIYFGEIVASSLTSWTVQCWKLNQFPALGALVFFDDGKELAFGVVTAIQTEPKDAHRRPVAFGKTLEELQQEQPHIFQLLQSTITCVPVGYAAKKRIFYEIPRRPAAMHAFVGECTREQAQQFFARL